MAAAGAIEREEAIAIVRRREKTLDPLYYIVGAVYTHNEYFFVPRDMITVIRP